MPARSLACWAPPLEAVDGRNPVNSPVEVGSEHPISYDRVLYIPGGDRRISEPSTVGTPACMLGVIM